MYAVIFRTRARALDEDYVAMAGMLQKLARERYGCRDFVSFSDNGAELTISYGDDLAAIAHWRDAAEHMVAQRLGRISWYASYTVEVAEIKRAYRFAAES